MRKKNNTILYSILIGVILFGAVSIIYLGVFQSFFQGFTVTGISMANPPVKGQTNTWIINTLYNGWGQSIQGNYNQGEITYQGASNQYPLSITGSLSENKAFYIINNAENQREPVYKYTTTEKHGSVTNYIVLGYFTAAAQCDGKPAYEIKTVSPVGFCIGVYPLQLCTAGVVLARTCVYREVVATTAPISSSPNIQPKVTTTVTANGVSKTCVLSTNEVCSFDSYGSVGFASNPVQGGSLGALSVGSQYKAAISPSENNWRSITQVQYNTWSNERTRIEAIMGSAASSQKDWSQVGCNSAMNTPELITQLGTCVKNYYSGQLNSINSYADAIKTTDQFSYTSKVNVLGQEKFASADTENGLKGFWVDLNGVIASTPNLVYRINSDWLAIKYPEGKPVVTSASGSPTPFNSGQDYTINVGVRNDGTGTGTFNIQNIQCTCGNLQKKFDVSPITLAKGATGSISITMVTPSESVDKTGTCSGIIIDTGSMLSAPWSVDCTMAQARQCEEGKLYCTPGSTSVQKCVNNQYVDEAVCQYGVYANCTCLENPNPCSGPNPPDYCNNICGNGVCDFGENQVNCDEDCSPDKPICSSDADCDDEDITTTDKCNRPLIGKPYCTHEKAPFDFTFIILGLIVVVSGLVGYVKTRDWVWGVIGVVAGLIGAIVLYILIQFILQNWLIILLGTIGIPIAIGALLLYFCGGAILTIILAIIASKAR